MDYAALSGIIVVTVLAASSVITNGKTGVASTILRPKIDSTRLSVASETVVDHMRVHAAGCAFLSTKDDGDPKRCTGVLSPSKSIGVSPNGRDFGAARYSIVGIAQFRVLDPVRRSPRTGR